MTELEQALEESLARLAAGEATLEECLQLYPEQAEALRPLLSAASKLEAGRTVQPSPTFKMRNRAQLLAHVRMHPRQPQRRLREVLFPRGFGLAFGRAVNAAFGLAAILLLVLGTITVLAQMALPGDALYRWKVGSERVWRAVHFDPFQTDLLLADRRVVELTQVAGDPQAEAIARQEYEQSLTTLVTEYTSPDSQEIISDALIEQQDDLAQAGVTVPELDRLLTTITPQEANLVLDNQVAAVATGRITYTLTLTNTGPASPVTTTLVSRLSPPEKLVSTSGAACTASVDGTVTCTLENLTTATPRRLTLTTAIDPCYTGVITQTAQTTGMNLAGSSNEAVAISTITAPYPRPAQIVYVQSSGQAHDLGLVASNNRVLNGDLHFRAAAPAWSPDGTQLAFVGEASISELGGVYSRGSGVWLADLVNTQLQNPRQIVAQDHVKNIAWSPDGTRLAFEVGPPKLPHEIRVVELEDGREISRFPGEQPAWRPDNQRLVIKSCLPGCGLWLINLEGREEQQITFDDSDSYPAWSPGGDYLAFASRRDQNWEIYLLRPADEALIRLTRRPSSDTTPVFDPCGQNLYLRTDAYGSWWVTVMKLDGSDERRIQEGVGPSDDWGLARPAIF